MESRLRVLDEPNVPLMFGDTARTSLVTCHPGYGHLNPNSLREPFPKAQYTTKLLRAEPEPLAA